MSDEGNPMVNNRSMLKDFLASIATMTGDLSNITAPPFILDSRSVIEIPSFWAENPSIFVSPSKSDDPVQRALLILRSFLSGLKSQCYMGHSPEEGVKKPLNAFLGELFIGKWEDDNGTTHMLSEQVSHHPPITACRVWNDEHGVIAEGYNRQTITFNGSVNVQCSGHILKTLTKFNENYLIPIPDFKVKGVLSTPYPELSGTYYLPSTNGYHSVIHFSGKSFFSSTKKHSFEAHLFKEQDGESSPIYTIEGQWDTEFTIRDNKDGEVVETFDIQEHALKNVPPLIVDSIDEQDPWESRRAWKETVSALKEGDMKGITDAKSHLEQGQRDMREAEGKQGSQWEILFFEQAENDRIVEELSQKVPNEDFLKSKAETEGIWKFKLEAWKSIKKPYHGRLKPDNTTRERSDSTAANDSEQGDRVAQDWSALQNEKKISQHDSGEADQTVGEPENGQSAGVNATLAHVNGEPKAKAIEGIPKDQPDPQQAQVHVDSEHHETGIEGMTLEEKDQIENMIRDQYSTASQSKRDSRAKRSSVDPAP